MMTVSELRKALESFPDDHIVVMSSDGEGNSFSPLCEFVESVYVADSAWSGELYLSELTDELEKQGYSEEDLYDGDDGQLAVVLWPTN